MQELSKKQLKKIERLSKIADKGEVALLEELDEIDEHFEAIEDKLEEVVNKEPEKGETGEKGDKGDKGDRGEKGDKGEDGKDGYTPIKGLDYFDGKDGKDGKDGRDGKDGKDAKIGWGAHPLRIEQSGIVKSKVARTLNFTNSIITAQGDKLNILTDLSGYVPYTGATTDVDLGAYKLTAGTSYQAIIGDDTALKAGYFYDSSTSVTLSNGTYAITTNGPSLFGGNIQLTGTGYFLDTYIDRIYRNSNSSVAIDITTNDLKDPNGLASLNFDTRTLIDTGGVAVANWSTTQLSDTSAIGALNWGSRVLTDTGGTTVLNWSAKELYSGAGALMLNWNGTFNISALAQITNTTEQLRVRYDASNYIGMTVSNAGLVTQTIVGTTPALSQTASRTGTYYYELKNTNAGNASSAFIVDTAGTGDPYARFTVAATSWSIGVDNSVSDNFVLSNATALGTNVYLSATTTGLVNIPNFRVNNTQLLWQNLYNVRAGIKFDPTTDRCGLAVAENELAGVTKSAISASAGANADYIIAGNRTANPASMNTNTGAGATFYTIGAGISYYAQPYVFATANDANSRYGYVAHAYFQTNGATVTHSGTYQNYRSSIQLVTATNNITTFSHMAIAGITAGGGVGYGTITNHYGVNISMTNQDSTNAYGIYQSSNTILNYFNGSTGIGTTAANSSLHVNGSIARAYRAITALRTLDGTDNVIDCTANSFAVTLPTAVGITGREYIIKNTGTGIITLNTTSSQTIDGVASGVLTLVQWDSMTVVSTGSNWIIIEA